MNPVLFSSKSICWETPQDLFDQLNEEFHFTLDVCALPENAKCQRFYSPEQDGLNQIWQGTCWCNPPYGREIGKWVQKAVESAKSGATVVMLLPARTDTRWFHEYIYGKAEIRFIKGRLKFGGAYNSAPFPSMICIFQTKKKGEPMTPIKFEISTKDTVGAICAKACLAAAAQYANENDLVIVGERDETGDVVYWFEERQR